MRSGNLASGSDVDADLDELAATATEMVLNRIDPEMLPDDESCPPTIRTAIRMWASRLWARRDSVGGVVSFGEFAVRVSKVDPDIDMMLSDFREGADP